jgi:hypothetical protein
MASKAASNPAFLQLIQLDFTGFRSPRGRPERTERSGGAGIVRLLELELGLSSADQG